MKTNFIEFIIFESPDTMIVNGKQIFFSSYGAYSFCANPDGECKIGKESETHPNIFKSEKENEFRENYDIPNDVSLEEYEDEMGISFDDYYSDLYAEDYSKQSYNYDQVGRFWIKEKIISFWKFPENKEQLKKLIIKIENKTGENIWNNNWKIEIIQLDSDNDKKYNIDNLTFGRSEELYDSDNDTYVNFDYKLIPLENFERSINPPKTEWEKHTKSPLNKKTKVPDGWGSHKYAWDTNNNIKKRYKSKKYQEKFIPKF